MTDVKPLVVKAFQTMLEEYTAQNNRWKCKAYRNALNTLNDIPEIVTLDDIKGAKGFGKSLTEHVKEIIDTHEMKAAKHSEKAESIKNLMTIHGIGVQTARKLIDKGLHTVDQLRNAYVNGEIKLTDAQKLGLKYYEDMHKRIPYAEMQKHEHYMQEMMTHLSKTATLSVVGSYRRKAPNSGDIDVLITDKDRTIFDTFIANMERSGYFFGTLAKGDVKYNGFCSLPGRKKKTARRVDVLYTSPEEYPFALLYFTGSGEYNKRMRAHALKKGYSLNQMNMIDMSSSTSDSETIVDPKLFKTEKDIFTFLEFPYADPENRV
jgi:DNA polymerase beta